MHGNTSDLELDKWKKVDGMMFFMPLCLISTVNQVVTFDMWPASVAGVKEVQNVTVSSSSCSDALCSSAFFSLGYGRAMTGNVKNTE